MKSMLRVEGLSHKTVVELRETIIEILNQGRGDEVICVALKTLSDIITKLPPVNVSNCMFKGSKKPKKYKKSKKR